MLIKYFLSNVGAILMNASKSNDVEKTLEKPDVHQKWLDSYRTSETHEFFEYAYNYILRSINAPEGSEFLDVGCGSGAHSIRLAKRGFSVLAIDFSEEILNSARENIEANKLQDKIRLQRENILSLPFEDGTFDYILCWGVLMHIPEIEKAISELERVCKKNGIIVISEANMYSLQAILLRSIKKILRSEKARLNNTPQGLEYWHMTSAGELLTREVNIGWLKNRFVRDGFSIKKHVSGQFTELYTRFSSPLIRRIIHGFNNIWFKYVKFPYFSFGNLLIIQNKK